MHLERLLKNWIVRIALFCFVLFFLRGNLGDFYSDAVGEPYL